MPTNSNVPDNKTILRIRKILEKLYNNSRFQSGEITLIARYLAKITKINNSTSPHELPAPMHNPEHMHPKSAI